MILIMRWGWFLLHKIQNAPGTVPSASQGQKHKQELKVAKAYEGWTKNDKNHGTVDTIYFSGYENTDKFDILANSSIAGIYDEDKIDHIILNGDGTPSISAETENNIQKIYQPDLFHIYQKANRKIKDKDLKKEIK